MVKKYRLSGMSTPFGIMFIGDNYSAWINTLAKKGNVDIDKLSVSRLSWVMKIPFIRGAFLICWMIFNVVWSLIKDLFKKPIWLIMIISTIIWLRIWFHPKPGPTPLPAWLEILLTIMLFVIYGLLLLFVFGARRNHSVEHKLIGAYEKGQNLGLKNVKRMPKEHRRCGGVLVAWFIVVMFVVNHVFGLDFSFDFLVFISVGYELALLAGRNGFVGKLFFFPGYLIQKLTTSNNVSNERILKARKALIALLKKENKRYKLR